MSERLLSRDDILNIPEEFFPMPLFSDNIRAFMAWGIKAHERGCYNHFMWYTRQGIVASQNLLYSEQKIESYFSKYRLKLWYNPRWTPEQRKRILDTIQARLALPWYRRLYDAPAIVGQLLWHEIQVPGLDICSDAGNYLSKADDDYDLEHPDPEMVNRWLEKHPAYEIYGRYVPD